MASLMDRRPPERLERSCPRAWIRTAAPWPGVERLEAFFAGHGFDPHRHDTYAIGLTLHGVQSFDYRGVTASSRVGQAVVLHPDERHDGRAGTEAGFRYRIAYIEPRLIQDAIDQRPRPLPFVRDPVTDDARLIWAIRRALEDLDSPIEALRLDQIIGDLAEALTALDRSSTRVTIDPACTRAVVLARDLLDANFDRPVRSKELEAATGLTRFTLARHFRACLGTSPYRYLVMRRLDRARRLMLAGTALAEAAVASGFADQSHMTRQFKKAYGVTPGRWHQLTAQRAPHFRG